MTINGCVQIGLFSVIVILMTRPLGGYMTRVFAGKRTFLSPVLQPVECAIHWCCGIDEKEEQHWLTYAAAVLFSSVVGFLSLYALQRLQWYLYLRVFIRGLRQKLEPDPTRPIHILTELGVGYRLQLPSEQRI